MAKIGLDNFLYGILTEAQDGTPTYGTATKPGKAVNCSVSISNNSASVRMPYKKLSNPIFAIYLFPHFLIY